MFCVVLLSKRKSSEINSYGYFIEITYVFLLHPVLNGASLKNWLNIVLFKISNYINIIVLNNHDLKLLHVLYANNTTSATNRAEITYDGISLS